MAYGSILTLENGELLLVHTNVYAQAEYKHQQR